ncbi:uncharacterized protein METZ01_LOCUS103365, partial [marine metagenome]
MRLTIIACVDPDPDRSHERQGFNLFREISTFRFGNFSRTGV